MTEAFTQRASGIIVPKATLDKTERTIPKDDFKRIERFMNWAGTNQKMLVVFHCETCKARVRMRRHHRLTDTIETPHGQQDAPGGMITVFCDCTNWAVR